MRPTDLQSSTTEVSEANPRSTQFWTILRASVAARRKALLAYFKDIDKIRAASIADLEIPQGMNKTAATAVYNFFHNDKQK